jgi:hypothetical protein
MDTVIQNCDSGATYDFIGRMTYPNIVREGNDFIGLKVIKKTKNVLIVRRTKFWAEFSSKTSYGYDCDTPVFDTVLNLKTPIQFSVFLNRNISKHELDVILNNMGKCTLIDKGWYMRWIKKTDLSNYEIAYSSEKIPYYCDIDVDVFSYTISDNKIIICLDRSVMCDADIAYQSTDADRKCYEIEMK